VVEIATTKGIAKPKACGQAITNTVAALSMAKATSCPAKSQLKKVTTPDPMATIVS